MSSIVGCHIISLYKLEHLTHTHTDSTMQVTESTHVFQGSIKLPKQPVSISTELFLQFTDLSMTCFYLSSICSLKCISKLSLY